jgi:hypothetical protein
MRSMGSYARLCIYGPDMVAHVYNPSPQEAEAGETKFEASLGYTVKPCLKKKFFKLKTQIYTCLY